MVQGNVPSNGEEVIANSDFPGVVGGLPEKFEAVELVDL